MGAEKGNTQLKLANQGYRHLGVHINGQHQSYVSKDTTPVNFILEDESHSTTLHLTDTRLELLRAVHAAGEEGITPAELHEEMDIGKTRIALSGSITKLNYLTLGKLGLRVIVPQEEDVIDYSRNRKSIPLRINSDVIIDFPENS